MTEDAASAETLLEDQRAHWDGVARAWAKWWPLIEVGARPVCDGLLDLVDLRPGDEVLDLACGIGEPALSAARRMGSTGRVTAVDLAPTMLEIGAQRARDAGVETITFVEMDASQPDFPDGSFDVVLSRWGLMFVPDLVAALTRVHRLLRPGGRFAMAVWGRPEQVPSISLVGRVLAAALELPPISPDKRTPFDLADIEVLSGDLRSAGFTELESAEVKVRNTYASVDEYLQFRDDLAAADPRLDGIAEDRMAAAREAVRTAVEAYQTDDGRVVMENLAICIGGRRG